MIDPNEVGVPKGEGQETIDTDITMISSESLDEVIELLEDSMKQGEKYLSHKEVRPSGHRMTIDVQSAYEVLIEAHPDYELKENE